MLWLIFKRKKKREFLYRKQHREKEWKSKRKKKLHADAILTEQMSTQRALSLLQKNMRKKKENCHDKCLMSLALALRMQNKSLIEKWWKAARDMMGARRRQTTSDEKYSKHIFQSSTLHKNHQRWKTTKDGKVLWFIFKGTWRERFRFHQMRNVF